MSRLGGLPLVRNIRENRSSLLPSLVGAAALSFILTVYLATDTFVNNFGTSISIISSSFQLCS